MNYATDRVWIVEILWENLNKWHATVGIGLSRDDGRQKLRDWQGRNPTDRFRLTRYDRRKGFQR